MPVEVEQPPNTACTRTRRGIRLPAMDSAPLAGFTLWLCPPNLPRAGNASR